MEESSAPFQAKQVAIVDDDLGMRSALRMLMERRGYSVVEFERGQELLDFLGTPGVALPYCVLMDLHMEGISGEETRRRMGNIDYPVLLITGDTKASEKVEPGLFEAILYKPLNWLTVCGLLQSFATAKAEDA